VRKKLKRKKLGKKTLHLYAKGRRFEYKAISILKKMGFQVVFRSPRSGGMFDIFALRGNPETKKVAEARYVQVKASRSSFPLKSIVSKKDREKIIKNKAVIMLGKNTFYEIWVRRLNKKWDVYRLNWGSKEFELFGFGKNQRFFEA
jgi:Holliday junction resolvase-like predicted endonuclease